MSALPTLVGERAILRAFAIEVGGERAGWLGIGEDEDPSHRSAGMDIVLGGPFQGRRRSPEARRPAARRLTGERVEGDDWRDGLLMDLLAEEPS